MKVFVYNPGGDDSGGRCQTSQWRDLFSIRNRPKKPLTKFEMMAFGCGDFASNLFWMTIIYFGMYFYTDAFGISAIAAGAIFGGARIWDAINDPIMGLISDRTHTSMGKFRPYLLWMAVPFAIVGILMFYTPKLNMADKETYAWITYILMGMVYTAINLPYSSLMGVVSPNPQLRDKFASYRFIGAYSGGLIVNLTTLKLVKILGGGDEAKGFLFTVMIFAVLAALLFLFTFLTSAERVAPPKNQQTNILRDLTDVITSMPWIIVGIMGMFNLGATSVRNGSIMYFFKYAVAGDYSLFGVSMGLETIVTVFMTAGAIANIAGMPFAPWIVKKMGKKGAYIFSMGTSGLLTAAYYVLPTDAIHTMFVLQVLINFFMALTAPIVFAMYTDIADFGEWKNGRRSTGLVMSAASFAQKLGWAGGGILGGVVLSWHGYVANKPQDEYAIEGILRMLSVYPAILAALAIITMLFYPITDEKLKRITADLELRTSKSRDGA